MRCPTTEKTGRLGQDLDSTTKTLIKKYWKKLGLNPKTYDRVTSVSNSVKQPGLNNCIWTTFMSAAWQYYDAQRYKPAEAAMGMSLYDHHL